MTHLFKGKSTLRSTNDPPSGPSQASLDLQSYLEEKYSSVKSTSSKKKKKKKEKCASGIRIVDKDVTGFASVEAMPTVEAIDPDGPIIVNEMEATAAERYQRKKKKKEYFGDGGWTQVDTEKQNSDLSPPRRNLNSDLSPPRRNLNSDLSPPRRNLNSDLSPPRRRQDSDLSPPRRRQDSDLSPPRRRQDSDLSPPRRRNPGGEKKRMMDGTKTGIMTGAEMRDELHKKQRFAKEKISKLKDDLTGRGAKTVYRNREGHRVSLEELKQEEEKEKRKITWEKVEWDSGLKQQRDAKRYKKELARESIKPFARTREDEDLNEMYKARVRWGDPMSHITKKQKTPHARHHHEFTPVIDETNRHWFEKSDFVIPQDAPEHSWIRRGVAPLSNRYNIRPGRHWDGVDRSNGFEKDYAKYMNEQAAKEREAAMWTMEDM